MSVTHDAVNRATARHRVYLLWNKCLDWHVCFLWLAHIIIHEHPHTRPNTSHPTQLSYGVAVVQPANRRTHRHHYARSRVGIDRHLSVVVTPVKDVEKEKDAWKEDFRDVIDERVPMVTEVRVTRPAAARHVAQRRLFVAIHRQRHPPTVA